MISEGYFIFQIALQVLYSSLLTASHKHGLIWNTRKIYGYWLQAPILEFVFAWIFSVTFFTEYWCNVRFFTIINYTLKISRWVSHCLTNPNGIIQGTIKFKFVRFPAIRSLNKKKLVNFIFLHFFFFYL